ncbi:MAG: redoxin family protein [Chthoniobacteraceae bacterium]
MRLHRIGMTVLWALASVLSASAQADCKEPAETSARPVAVDPEVRIRAIGGDEVRPFFCEGSAGRVAVLLFVTTDCPIANRYAPEIERIRADFEGKGLRMTLVHVDSGLTEKAAGDHAREYALKAPVVIDRTHRLVAATGAKVTPEAVVIDHAGRIRYRGRIDDQVTGYGDRRMAATMRDLRDAIAAVLEGRPVKSPETPAIGCLIPRLR